MRLRACIPALLSLLLLGPATGCREDTPAASPEPVRLESGAVAADMPGAQAVGEAVLAEGGSAVDAAIATVLALGVENPSSSGIGGGGFAVVWDAKSGRAYALDFRERAPSGADAARYRTPDGTVDPQRSLMGCLAAGVPGEVAGLEALHGRFGRLAWDRLVDPARSMAADGWTASPYLARATGIQRDGLASDHALAARYLDPQGRPIEAGARLRDPELAGTLERIRDEGADGFYRGEVAASIEAACRHVDGAIRTADLAAYRPVWRRPVIASWRGIDLLSVPPPSSGGGVIVEVLNILEPFGEFDRFGRAGGDAALSHHVLVESLKHGFADRATSYGDPDHVDVPLDELTSPVYAERLRRGIDADRTRPSWAYGRPGGGIRNDAGTSHVSVVDADGNAVAITSSVNELFGSLVRAPRSGVLLNNTMDDFSLDDAPNVYGLVGSKRNRIAPGRRPVSSMAPLIALQHGQVRLAAGGSGGPRIISATLQTALGVLAEGLTVEEALEAPRVHHQWMPEKVFVEPGVDPRVIEGLRARGHVVEETPIIAAVQAVEVREGRAVPAVDPRKRDAAWASGAAPTMQPEAAGSR